MSNVKHFKLIVLFCEVSRHENPENFFNICVKLFLKENHNNIFTRCILSLGF